MNRNSFAYLSFALALIFSGYVFSACKKSEPTPPKELTAEEKLKKENYEALEAKKAEYTTIPAKEQLVKEPYLKKKLIFYRYDSTKSDNDKWLKNDFGTDKFGSSLPYEVNKKMEYSLANSPDEVGIIALEPECKSVEAGTYGGTTTAYKQRCEIILIDPELSAVVYRTTFDGALDSTKYIGAEKSVTARVDGTDIVDFLSNLRSKSNNPPLKKTDKK